jgi:hypothetical protein
MFAGLSRAPVAANSANVVAVIVKQRAIIMEHSGALFDIDDAENKVVIPHLSSTATIFHTGDGGRSYTRAVLLCATLHCGIVIGFMSVIGRAVCAFSAENAADKRYLVSDAGGGPIMTSRRRSATTRSLPAKTPEQLLELAQKHIRPLIDVIDRLNEVDAEDELRVISKQLTRLCFRVQPLPSDK